MTDPMKEAVKHLSAEAAAAIDLYILEEGPLQIERDQGGMRLVVKQNVRLRLKSADELRAEGYEQGQRDERAAAVQRVEALPAYVNIPYENPSEVQDGDSKDWLHYREVIAAIKGGSDE